MQHEYLLALGSNRWHHRHGRPEQVLLAARDAIAELGEVEAMSRVMQSVPIGPSKRRFANAALILSTNLDPQPLLDAVKQIERDFGRRPGRRWGERVLDIDIILWSGGRYRSRRLIIPHELYRQRDFVMKPALEIRSYWPTTI